MFKPSQKPAPKMKSAEAATTSIIGHDVAASHIVDSVADCLSTHELGSIESKATEEKSTVKEAKKENFGSFSFWDDLTSISIAIPPAKQDISNATTPLTKLGVYF